MSAQPSWLTSCLDWSCTPAVSVPDQSFNESSGSETLPSPGRRGTWRSPAAPTLLFGLLETMLSTPPSAAPPYNADAAPFDELDSLRGPRAASEEAQSHPASPPRSGRPSVNTSVCRVGIPRSCRPTPPSPGAAAWMRALGSSFSRVEMFPGWTVRFSSISSDGTASIRMGSSPMREGTREVVTTTVSVGCGYAEKH